VLFHGSNIAGFPVPPIQVHPSEAAEISLQSPSASQPINTSISISAVTSFSAWGHHELLSRQLQQW